MDKSNVFRSYAFFRKIFTERAEGFPDIAPAYRYIDAMALDMDPDYLSSGTRIFLGATDGQGLENDLRLHQSKQKLDSVNNQKMRV